MTDGAAIGGVNVGAQEVVGVDDEALVETHRPRQ